MRADQQILPHRDYHKAELRIRKAALSAKIIWIGRLSQYDRETLLKRLKLI